MPKRVFKPECPKIIHNGEELKATRFEAAKHRLDIHAYLVECGVREPEDVSRRNVIGEKIATGLRTAKCVVSDNLKPEQ